MNQLFHSEKKIKALLVYRCSTGIDLDEARRKREDNIVQLRKDKRDENLQKKRMVGTIVPQADEITNASEGGIMQQKVSLQVGPTNSPGKISLSQH